jgi:hypothetical protein
MPAGYRRANGGLEADTMVVELPGLPWFLKVGPDPYQGNFELG